MKPAFLQASRPCLTGILPCKLTQVICDTSDKTSSLTIRNIWASLHCHLVHTFAIEHYATLLKFKGLIFLSFYCNNKAKDATGSTSSCSTVCITRRMAVCFQRKSDNHWRSGPAVVVETQTNLHTRTHTHAHMRARTHTHTLIKRVSSPEKEEMIRKPISLLNRKQTPVAHFSFRNSHTSLASTHFQHHPNVIYIIFTTFTT